VVRSEVAPKTLTTLATPKATATTRMMISIAVILLFVD